MVMQTTETKDRVEDATYWQQHSELFSTSGLSRAAYCREHQLNYHCFGYWLKRLTPSTALLPVTLTSRDINDQLLCSLVLRSGERLMIHDRAALIVVLDKVMA